MFSGIVEETASVCDVIEGDRGRRVTLYSHLDHASTRIGDSISVDGVCLTVVEIQSGQQNGWLLSFDVASETLRCTTLGSLVPQSSVHLERSLALGDRLHGHLVTGHVDGVGVVQSLEYEGETTKVQIALSSETALVSEKGSLALAGVSLTIGSIQKHILSFYLIPHTKSVTRLGQLKQGDLLNYEFDVIARYVNRALQCGGYGEVSVRSKEV